VKRPRDISIAFSLAASVSLVSPAHAGLIQGCFNWVRTEILARAQGLRAPPDAPRPLPGRTLSRLLEPRETREAFRWGSLPEIIQQHPELAAKHGLYIEGESVRYPDFERLNAFITDARRSGDPHASSVTFWSSEGEGEAGLLEFSEHWGDHGEAPIAAKGRHHHHDSSVHLLGYAILPREIVAISRARFRTLLRLVRAPGLARLRPAFEETLRRDVLNLDTATASLSTLLASERGDVEQISHQFNRLARGPETLLQSSLDFTRLSAAERKEADGILAKETVREPSLEMTLTLAQSLIARLWPPR
jgi:hypothetical protein